ncbi:MAG: hypothetical protein ABI947_02275 [Chloroflexota bacterium]
MATQSKSSPANPIFDSQVQQLGWPHTSSEMQQYIQIVIAIAALVTLLIGVANKIGFNNTGSYAQNFIFDFMVPFNLMLFVAGTLVGFIADICYAVLPIHSIQQEILSGHWELQRLTPHGDSQMIAAKDGIAQLRGQRIVIVEYAVRGITVISILFGVLLYVVSPNSANEIVIIGLGTLLVILVAIPYVLEPRWRMRALIAVGMAAAIQSSTPSMAVLTALAYALGARLLQLLIIVGVCFGVLTLIFAVFTMPFLIPLGGYLDYRLYKWVRFAMLKRVEHLAAKERA